MFASRLVARDVASGLTLWLRWCAERGEPVALESLELLRVARAQVRGDAPLPQVLPLPSAPAGWVREYDSAGVARVLGCSARWARWLAVEARLPARRVGRSWVFDADAVDAYSRCRVSEPGPTSGSGRSS